uniref:C2H2-type domain-containing protein n=1 Tax=viral metagenome TaxID=1070528 RepID=A0A6M3Y5D9_9ZZZZ
MKQTNEKVYRCDFCNRAIVSAGSMKLHERMCKKNPQNQHQCFKYCENLVKEQFDINDEDGHKCSASEISFTCKKRPNIGLYSYKLERYKSKQKRLENMERMPLECELYKAEQGHDFSPEVDNIYY